MEKFYFFENHMKNILSILSRKDKHRVSGFTLIELLIVITIIAIFSGAGVASYTGSQKAARDAKRKGDLRTLQLALQQYYADNLSYPIITTWSGESTGFGSHTADYIPDLVPKYIERLPNDPRANKSYSPCDDPSITGYVYRSNGQDFKLLASCGPEGNYGSAATNPFYDPTRPSTAWQVSTPGAVGW